MAADIGQAAPDVTLTDRDLKQRALSEWRGKNLVLAFMPGAFTGVCTKESCTFRDSAAQFEQLNAQVVGITVDTPHSQKAWADQNSFNFPVLSDWARQAVPAYGIEAPDWLGMPGYTNTQRSVFIIDKDGVIRYKWIASVMTDEPNYQEIQEALAQL